MSTMASQITGVSIVYSTVCSGADQRKHQSSASLAFVRGIHWWPMHFQHKGPATRKKMFPFDGVIMTYGIDIFKSWNFFVGEILDFANLIFSSTSLFNRRVNTCQLWTTPTSRTIALIRWPQKSGFVLKNTFFQDIFMINTRIIPIENTLLCILQYPTVNELTFVQLIW